MFSPYMGIYVTLIEFLPALFRPRARHNGIPNRDHPGVSRKAKPTPIRIRIRFPKCLVYFGLFQQFLVIGVLARDRRPVVHAFLFVNKPM